VNKIMICGCMGAGKSTFTKKLSETFNIPSFKSNDLFNYNKSCGVKKEDYAKRLDELIASNNYIIDGYIKNIIELYDLEFDLIVVLYFNYFLCVYRAFTRTLKSKFTLKKEAGIIRTLDIRIFKWVYVSRKAAKRDIEMNYKNMIVVKNDKELRKLMSDLLDKNSKIYFNIEKL